MQYRVFRGKQPSEIFIFLMRGALHPAGVAISKREKSNLNGYLARCFRSLARVQAVRDGGLSAVL